MDTEFLAALDDVNDQIDEAVMTSQAFSPPSLSSSQLKQLELLQHLSLYSELIILICAEKGMGKTFIAKALFATREAPDQSLMFDADFSLSYLDILHNLAQFLDLADLADDVDGIEQQLLVRCSQIAEEDQGSVLLIIDQAEQLSDGVLGSINQLALVVPNALHVMLLAPLGFENKLLALPVPQAPFHMMDIELFADDEAEILLLEQFPEKEWEAEQADYIVQQSAGNPGKILYLAQQLLLGAKPSQQTSAEAKFPVTHLAAIALVALAFIAAYFYQSSRVDIDAETVSVSDIAVVETAIVQEAPSLDVAKDNELVIGQPEVLEDVDFNFSQAALDETAEVVTVDTRLVQPVLLASVNESRVSSAESSSRPDVEEPKVIYSSDEQSLLVAASNAFIIQLFGSYSADNAQTFIATHTTKAMALLRYQTEYNGKPWHVVVAGPFETRAMALQQSKAMPITLRNQKPWIRPVTTVQSVLSKRK